LAFPKKPKSPSGATTGSIPPEKMVPFFRKNSRARQVHLDLSLEQIHIEREQPSGKDARAGDSLRLQQDTALLPRLWTSEPLMKLNFSSSNSPRQRKRAVEQRDKWNKNITSIYKMFQTSSCSLHGHMARILISEQKGLERPMVFRLEGRRHQERLGTGNRRSPRRACRRW
jgi:hypothetical protein